MDKSQALHAFWSSFGLPAYDMYSVPDGATMPYITYEAATDDFENDVQLNASLWYRTTSWEQPCKKADEIAAAINEMASPTPIDGGYMWVKRGTPFAQRMGETDQENVKRMVVIIIVNYLTAY